MYHAVAWSQSLDPANALSPLDAVPDEIVFTVLDDIRVPPGFAHVLFAAGLGADASFSRAQLQAPSLRAFVNLDIEPLELAASFTDIPSYHDLAENPLVLIPNESMQFHVLSDPAAAAIHRGIVFLGDGPVQKVRGNVFSVRATGAIAQVEHTWVSGALTFTQNLPAGTYDVVGLRVRAASGAVGRLIFPAQIARPGVPVLTALDGTTFSRFRNGNYGILGRFEVNQPPRLEMLGGTAVAQVAILDLIKVA